MKQSLIALLLALTFCLALMPPSLRASSPAQERFSLRTLTPYDPNRVGYESLVVKLIGAGGGKLGPREKFKVFASGFKNEAAKNIKAIRFSYFIFKSDDLDVAIDTGHTDIIPLELMALERRWVRIHVVNVDDVPSLAYQPGHEFHLEVAVTEVHYSDGSIWQAADLPGKMNRTKEP